MQIQEIVTLITTVLFGGGWLMQVIKGKQEQKKRDAEASVTSADAESKAVQIALDSAREWKSIAEERETKIDLRDSKIDELYNDRRKDRELIFSLQEENANLKVCKTEMKMRLCSRKLCAQREPQTGY